MIHTFAVCDKCVIRFYYKMILIQFLCLISTTLAYRFADQSYRHGFRSNEENKLYNNNFSEDEFIAINNYKSGMNSRHFNTMDDVFDDRLFDNRRLFGWVSKLFRKNKPINTHPKPRYEDLINDKIFYLNLTKNLTENLTKLTNILELFTKTLKDKSISTEIRRVPRSIKDKHHNQSVEHADAGNSIAKTNTDSKIDNKKIFDSSKNDSIEILEDIDDDSIEKPNEETKISGRRSFNSFELKNKLLSAINDTLNVIQYKIRSVSNIQEIFADKPMFKVGYIAGSLKAIKGFIDELQIRSVNNNTGLNDKYILDMYDTVTRIKDSSGRILELLNVYVDRATSELIKN